MKRIISFLSVIAILVGAVEAKAASYEKMSDDMAKQSLVACLIGCNKASGEAATSIIMITHEFGKLIVNQIENDEVVGTVALKTDDVLCVGAGNRAVLESEDSAGNDVSLHFYKNGDRIELNIYGVFESPSYDINSAAFSMNTVTVSNGEIYNVDDVDEAWDYFGIWLNANFK